ncbi:hypothetical protein BD626DRAFT_480595 [Schizophyllum amplum]|uniref:Phospholipid/glycerol acyltransferase domain-containing protein n=1 Tax=Schizophyllum amplum TaxID=97359 RepID=A0A550CTB6_9AGAR|nr:hypothetical protein BD626DRAFT_480595 [Auriculariopsis ampla]
MEKYSAYRDPGTGIQPFLTPVPPLSSSSLGKLIVPFAYALGALRLVLVLAFTLIHVLLVDGLCLLFWPIPPLHRLVTGILTALTTRAILFICGFFWIPVEVVTRQRGRGAKPPTAWRPRAGDIIVSNWVSWVELLWLAFRFDPIFVCPVAHALPVPSTPKVASPIAHTPGRRTGTGSAAAREAAPRVPLTGFRTASLLEMVGLTGTVLPAATANDKARSLEDIRKMTDRPLVVFPECTTSNGRGLLRFADVFGRASAPKGCSVFVMCVRCDPPTTFTPTPTLSIPLSTLSPLAHVFKLCATLIPPAVSIRLLSTAELPSTGTFIASEVLGAPAPAGTSALGTDAQLTEVCATLIAQIGKMKRVGLGWEDKVAFLDFYHSKRR